MAITEVVIHGRGGQGAVTTSQLQAIAAFKDGKYSQGFPTFGVERSGTPVRSFVRISDKPIRIRSEVCSPDYAIVLDTSLMGAVDICGSVKKSIIVNCNKCISVNKESYVVDATSIAIKTIGQPFVNIAMVGAFAKVTKLVSLKSI